MGKQLCSKVNQMWEQDGPAQVHCHPLNPATISKYQATKQAVPVHIYALQAHTMALACTVKNGGGGQLIRTVHVINNAKKTKEPV